MTTDTEKLQQMADRIARDRSVVTFAEKAHKDAESVRLLLAMEEKQLEATRRVVAVHQRERDKVAALQALVRKDANLRVAAARAEATAKLFDRIEAGRYETVQALVKTPAVAKMAQELTRYFDDHYESARAMVAPAVGSATFAAAEAASRFFDEQSESIRALVAPSAASAVLAASDAATRFLNKQGYDKVFASMAARVPDVAAASTEALSQVLSESLLLGEQVEDEAGSTAHDTEDYFAETLSAFIALGLSGRDLAVNTTTLAWLLTVENVRRVWGRKAARRALATFIAVAWMVLHAAWLVNDAGKAPSDAFATAMAGPLATLLYVWGKTGGE